MEGGPFRILERFQWRKLGFEEQAKAIKEMTQRYNVEYIGIDTTGMGVGVFPLVKQFFPAATPVSYSPEVKTRMVLKAQNIMGKGRLHFDAGWIDIAQSLLQFARFSPRAVAWSRMTLALAPLIRPPRCLRAMKFYRCKRNSRASTNGPVSASSVLILTP